MTQTYTTQSKSQLARLLATENIRIMQGNYPTASFDLKNRIMRLPQWIDLGQDVYDMLIGHEVSHALHTPEEGWHNAQKVDGVPHSFLNVLEDARIEQLIQNKYPGLIGPFKRAYERLLTEGIFGEFNIEDLNLIDKINVKAKTKDGSITFDNDKEWSFYNRAVQNQTWEQVVDLARDIIEYIKENQEDVDKESMTLQNFGESEENEPEDGGEDRLDMDMISGDNDDQSAGESAVESDNEDQPAGQSQAGSAKDNQPQSDSDNEENDQQAEGNESDQSGGNESDQSGGGATNNTKSPNSGNDSESGEMNNDQGDNPDDDAKEPDLESKTDQAFRENEKSLIEEQNMSEVGYVSAFPRQKMYDELKNVSDWMPHFESAIKPGSMHDEITKVAYQRFKLEQKKIVNSMIQKFEMKKNAATIRKSRQSKTGTIDALKLHSYKFSEDIFKSCMVMPDGQSHGIVMFVDLSSSMNSTMINVIQNILILTEFCKRQKIKFGIYGFKDSFDLEWTDVAAFRQDLNDPEKDIMFEDNIMSSCDLHMVELISSDMSAHMQEKAARMLFLAFNWEGWYGPNLHYLRCLSSYEDMEEVKFALKNLGNRSDFNKGIQTVTSGGGTPLNEALIAAHYIVPDFKNKHKLDKISTIVLTDGEGSSLSIAHIDRYDNRVIKLMACGKLMLTIPGVVKDLEVTNNRCMKATQDLVASLIRVTNGAVLNVDFVQSMGYSKYYLDKDVYRKLADKKEGIGYAIIDQKSLQAADVSRERSYKSERSNYTKLFAINNYWYVKSATADIDQFRLEQDMLSESEKRKLQGEANKLNTVAKIKNNFIMNKKSDQIKNVVFTGIAEQIAVGL